MTRAELHRLVDALPDASLETAALLLQRAQNPVLARLDAAPWDDEPYTDEERAEDDAAFAAYQRGEGTPLEDLMAELDADDAAVG
jgi:hypothetical protein